MLTKMNIKDIPATEHALMLDLLGVYMKLAVLLIISDIIMRI